MIYVTVKLKNANVPHANKVALRCDIDFEDIQTVAEEFFKDICKSDNLVPDHYEYKIYIRSNKIFYLLTKD